MDAQQLQDVTQNDFFDVNMDLDIINDEHDHKWNKKKSVGYELTDTKCFKTPSGVQKTATIDRQHLPMKQEEFIREDIIQKPDLEESEINSGGSDSRRKLEPLRRMTFRIGKKILKFKIINANEAPDGPDTTGSLMEPIPISVPKALAGLYQCSECKSYFGNKDIWLKHTAEAHGDPTPFSCFNCGMKFATKSSMTLHLREHSLLKPVYPCLYCPSLFSKIENRNLHQKMHAVRHNCTQCNRFFRTEESLNNHIRINHSYRHNDHREMVNGRIARFTCSYCRKLFHHKRDMIIHERIHTGERPYTCSYCGRGFAQSQTLDSHIRTHTDDLPYKCDVCNKRFRNNSSLRKHELARHVTMPVPGIQYQTITRSNEVVRSYIIDSNDIKNNI